jgi:hypothetical protein
MSRLSGKPKRTRRRRGEEQPSEPLEYVRRRFGRTTSAKSKGGAYGKAVGLGISALVVLTVISLSVWLLRKRAREEETASVTPEPEEGVEAVHSEEVIPPSPPSAEEASTREEPPPGEERPERRGEAPTSPPTPREEPPAGEERPGSR